MCRMDRTVEADTAAVSLRAIAERVMLCPVGIIPSADKHPSRIQIGKFHLVALHDASEFHVSLLARESAIAIRTTLAECRAFAVAATAEQRIRARNVARAAREWFQSP